MFAVPLSAEAEKLMRDLAEKLGVAPEEFARRAILDHMEDVEDRLLAEERLRTSDGRSVALDDIMDKYGRPSAAE